jgi:glycosyltransferase involved in cell wall biosynthesis
MTLAVSVVMTAFNAEAFVGEALRSALEQTVPPAQVVVVDDGSTDTTTEVVSAFEPDVTLLRQEHAGIGLGRNTGLAAAPHPLIALLDADDVWLPRKLECQLAAFDEDPVREAVFCWFDEFADREHPPPAAARPPRRQQSAALTSGALLSRALIDRLGPFGAGRSGDWVEWWARARAMGVVEHVVPEVLYRRRLHGSNSSFLERDGGQAFMAIARQHLRELRARPSSTGRAQ